MAEIQDDSANWAAQVGAELTELDDLLDGGSSDELVLETIIPRLQSLIEEMEKVASGNSTR